MVIAGLRAEFPSEAGWHPGAAAWRVSCTCSFTPLPITEYSLTLEHVQQRWEGRGEGAWTELTKELELIDWACQEANTHCWKYIYSKETGENVVYKGFSCLQEFLLFTLDQIIFTV